MKIRLAATWSAIFALLLFPRPGDPAGFDFTDQGGKAAGMAGAFVAQADDPTAIYYNIGGLALSEGDKKVVLGLSVHTLNESLYQGLPPGIGSGTASEQKAVTSVLPHVYLVLPVSDRLTVGVGLMSPFAFETDWLKRDSFAGRGVATNAKLITYDVNPSLSFAATETVGFGFGLIYRSAELKLGRRFFATDPATGNSVDVGDQQIVTDFDDGFGFNVGLLHRPSDRFSWGISYRSAINIRFNATGTLTQIPSGNSQLDSLLAISLPFLQKLAGSSKLDFPESLTVGVAVNLGDSLVLEVDAQWTAWSSFKQLQFDFPAAPVLDHTIVQSFTDSTTLRAGVQYSTPSDAKIRLGVAFDPSPQPDPSVGPWLVDADRTVVTAGFGKDPLDVALVWVDYKQRIIGNQRDGLNGNYRSSAWKLILSLSF